MISLLVLASFMISLIIFGVVKERKEQRNAYAAAQTRETDSISSALRKLRYCMTYDLRTIKWRRSILSAGIVTSLLFVFVWRTLPTPSELLAHLLIVAAVFEAVWCNFSRRTGCEAATYVDGNIDQIKDVLTKNHSFILPNWS